MYQENTVDNGDLPVVLGEDSSDLATTLYVESLGVSLSDQLVRTEKIDANHERSGAEVVVLRKQSLRLLSRLRQLDLRLSKLPAEV